MPCICFTQNVWIKLATITPNILDLAFVVTARRERNTNLDLSAGRHVWTAAPEGSAVTVTFAGALALALNLLVDETINRKPKESTHQDQL